MIIMTNTETNISANFRDEQTAYFAAKGGVEEVRDRMRNGAPDSLYGILPTKVPGASGTNAVLYITNPLNSETVTPWATTGNHYPDDQICTEGGTTMCSGSPLAPTVPSSTTWYTNPSGAVGLASTSYAITPALTWKWVRVMAKINKSDTGAVRVTSVDGAINGNRVCWNGKNEVTTAAASCSATTKPVYELTSLAVTPGGSRRMMQFEVTQNSFPGIPGAFVFDGSVPNFSPPSSTPFIVNGTDAAQGPTAGAGCPAAGNQPALGAFDSGSATTLNGDITKRPADYTATSPITPIQNQYGPLSSGPINLTTVDGLTSLVNLITTAAGPNVYTSGATPTYMGTTSPLAPVINVVQGDFSLGGSGAGILLVTGQLTLTGGFSYNGIILVVGEGAIVKNGGGGGTVNGAMFEANLFSDLKAASSGPGAYPGYSSPIALGSNNPPGVPYFGWSGGGNATIQYDSCWIQAVTNSLPFHLVTQREMSY
jgi:hypothetical protein